MSQKILPSSEFKQYKFTCPKCSWNHWFTSNQLLGSTITYKCDCGATFKPCLSLDDSPKKNESTTDNRPFNIAVTMLQVYGKNKQQATEYVKAVFTETKTLEQLIMDAINYASRLKT